MKAGRQRKGPDVQNGFTAQADGETLAARTTPFPVCLERTWSTLVDYDPVLQTFAQRNTGGIHIKPNSTSLSVREYK